MISIHAKKHDNFSVEFKFGFSCHEDGVTDQFSVNTWVFVPNSLDINPENYGKKQFYRDIKSNVRLITPVYLLRDIAKDSSLPLTSLRKALEQVVISSTPSDLDAYEYHLKMFAAIFKSAVRDQSRYLCKVRSLESSSYLVEDYVSAIKDILRKFRSLYVIIDVPTVSEKTRSHFRLCDEFISHVVSYQTMRVIKAVEGDKKLLVDLVMAERDYKSEQDYAVVTDNQESNKLLVYHRGLMKKYIESDLYIRLNKKKDGVAVEQLYYSIAAGVAMIFATGVAWIIQMKYGNITWPLFVALVISYMMKDRIKELMRYYFAHKLGNKYYDKKANITIGDRKVGVIKEGFDFISESRLPSQVLKMREDSTPMIDETRIFEEKIMLYRKNVTIDDKALAENGEYPVNGINEIMRLHLNRFTQKMDNPEIPVDKINEDGSVKTIYIKKVYYVNIVFQFKHDDEHSQYHHFRIEMTRNGVSKVEKL